MSLIIIIIIPLIFISAVPSITIIYVVNIWLEGSKIPLKTFAIVSMVTALITGKDLELKNGLVSLPFQLAVLSTVWVLFFIIVFLGYRLVNKNKSA
ncbi:MAG: hypothetical protein ACKE5M_07495 [Methylophilaceae bacterium]